MASTIGITTTCSGHGGNETLLIKQIMKALNSSLSEFVAKICEVLDDIVEIRKFSGLSLHSKHFSWFRKEIIVLV